MNPSAVPRVIGCFVAAIVGMGCPAGGASSPRRVPTVWPSSRTVPSVVATTSKASASQGDQAEDADTELIDLREQGDRITVKLAWFRENKWVHDAWRPTPELLAYVWGVELHATITIVSGIWSGVDKNSGGPTGMVAVHDADGPLLFEQTFPWGDGTATVRLRHVGDELLIETTSSGAPPNNEKIHVVLAPGAVVTAASS
jgi:hypothetical protein